MVYLRLGKWRGGTNNDASQMSFHAVGCAMLPSLVASCNPPWIPPNPANLMAIRSVRSYHRHCAGRRQLRAYVAFGQLAIYWNYTADAATASFRIWYEGADGRSYLFMNVTLVSSAWAIFPKM